LAPLVDELPVEPALPGVRDSTGAALLSSGTFDAQPAKTAEDTAAMRARRDIFMVVLLLVGM
jgi:hypothetical protein